MPEINSFPIQTKTIDELDNLTNEQSSSLDRVIVYDESVGVWKSQTLGERDKSKVIPLDNITAFPNLIVSGFSDRQQFHLNSFAPDGVTGGGSLAWSPNLPKSLHDGKNYFSPTVPVPTDFNDPVQVQNYLDGVGEEFPADNGVFALTDKIAANAATEQEILEGQANDKFLTPNGASGSLLRTFKTVAEMASLIHGLDIGVVVSTKGCLSIGDGGAGVFIVDAASGTPDGYSRVLLANGNHGVLQPVNGAITVEMFGGNVGAAIRYAKAAGLYIAATSDITVLIPTDTTAMQDAVDFIKIIGEYTLTLNIESGHQLTSGISVLNGDYSRVEITSDDAEVQLNPAFPRVDIISGVNSKMPTLGCLIDANGLGDHGYRADECSIGTIRAGCGIRRCYRTACRAYSGSTIYANSAIFTEAAQIGSNESGILVWGARVFAEYADVSGSLYYGAQAAAAGELSFRGGIANNTGRYGVRATNRGSVDARRVTANNNARYGIYAYMSSMINAMGAVANGNAEGNIVAIAASTISFSYDTALEPQSCDGGGSVAQLYASRASTIDAQGCTLTNGTNDAVYAENGSTINVSVSNISGYARHGCRARGSTIIADVLNINGSGSTGQILRSEASTVTSRAIVATNSPVAAAFFVSEGGTMRLTSNGKLDGSPIVAGNTNVLAGVNQIDGVRGIIYL